MVGLVYRQNRQFGQAFKLIDDGLQSIIELRSHLVHRLGEAAERFTFVDRQAAVEFASGKTFCTALHLF